MNEEQVLRYTCPKCGNKHYSIGEMYFIGNFWERIFRYHYRKFTYVTCNKCHFTEFFKVPKKMIGEVFNNLAR
jgi:uncharacterized protein